MYYKIRNNHYSFQNPVQAKVNSNSIFSYNTKYHAFYSEKKDEVQDDEILVENYQKLSNQINLENSFSENNASISESDSISKAIISDVLNTSEDNLYNLRHCNIVNEKDKLFSIEKDKFFEMESINFLKEKKTESRSSSMDQKSNSNKISFNENGDSRDNKENSSNSTRETTENSVKYDSLENLSLDELSKISLNLSHDQTGCRYLQRILEQNDTFADIIFENIKINLLDVINDPFGNYLIQKMIEKLSKEKLEALISLVNSNFLNLAKNPQGTRVIQKLIENISNSNLKSNVEKNALELLKDNNGYHIILKYTNLSKKQESIDKTIEEHLLEIAMNKFGCCAIQKYLQLFPSQIIIKMIILNTEKLITNVYGNYVIQFIISMNNQEYNCQIIEKFKNNIIYLSKQKFSSNVIERCFDYCRDSAKNILINYICEERVVGELLLDMYGNYVLQKALCSCKEPYYTKFMIFLGPLVDKLKNVSFGSKLYNKLMQNYPEIKKYKLRKSSFVK